MREKVTFILGLHNHQPVGNFDHIFEEAYQQAYKPFLEVLSDYPDIPFALHNSGVLWDWLLERHPGYLETVGRMAAAGQVEIMSGGYYEPILTVIPERDRQGQLEMMRDFIRKRFKTVPRGCWLTERIWDPHLPATLAGAGLEYVIVDDSHFKSTGFTAEEMRGFFLSEENGAYVRVFPIDKKLRYLIPFHDPEEAIDHFRQLAGEEGEAEKVAVLADDGEKFGLWTGTHSLCYGEKWLRRFCDALQANSDWLEVSTFSRVIDRVPPRGIVYLPTASYSEMMEWALPLRAQEKYYRARDLLAASGEFPEPAEQVRGGLWRNFLVKYEESNWMHKRMLQVSDRVDRYGEESALDSTWNKARRHLYQAQCNCAYWHGLFGGLYLPHLRSAVFRHLIEAEALIYGKGSGSKKFNRSYQGDIDGDGCGEIVLSSPSLQAILKLQGARLRELDARRPAFNLTDTLTRREEVYHRELSRLEAGEAGGNPGEAVSIHEVKSAKEEGLGESLVYDRWPRFSLVDHFIPGNTGLEAFAAVDFEELGDFVEGMYNVRQEESGDGGVCVFERKGLVGKGGEAVPVTVRKAVSLPGKSPALEVKYLLTPAGGKLRGRFAVENVFSFLAGNAPDRYFEFPGRLVKKIHLASRGQEKDVAEVSMIDRWLGLSVGLTLDPPALLWRFPIETVSNSDSGFERVYQGSALVPVWDLETTGEKPVEINIVIRVGTLSP
ncbi:MAG: DUF1926 domain-containing protein [Candidatus Krumholzibacteriota bacterium]|nr:DUF1926 domain-containing protein [Candidatus Krumholzibacteriota bacterium]